MKRVEEEEDYTQFLNLQHPIIYDRLPIAIWYIDLWKSSREGKKWDISGSLPDSRDRY